MKKFLFLFLFSVISMATLMAQSTVTGTLTDVDGTPLIGATVVEKSGGTGTATDIEGKYSLNVPSGATLEFSYTGFTTREVLYTGQSEINIALSQGLELDEVVVTALGIKREASTLTYAQQTVGGDELTLARDVNFLNSLSGKAAGVEIQKSSGGAGGSTKVVLRGDKSLSGSSSPLFVIDGIPMANNKGSQAGMWGGVDGGDGMF